MSNIDWPDKLDPEMGIFTYYGDNQNPGHELHDTARKGNLILKNTFDALHNKNRSIITPFFIFTKGPLGRDVYFRGLAVPGSPSMSNLDDLIAVWKTKDGHRFQNYRAEFSVLNEPVITRSWINDLLSGDLYSPNAPRSWVEWSNKGKYDLLLAPKVKAHRTRKNRFHTIRSA